MGAAAARRRLYGHLQEQLGARAPQDEGDSGPHGRRDTLLRGRGLDLAGRDCRPARARDQDQPARRNVGRGADARCVRGERVRGARVRADGRGRTRARADRRTRGVSKGGGACPQRTRAAPDDISARDATLGAVQLPRARAYGQRRAAPRARLSKLVGRGVLAGRCHRARRRYFLRGRDVDARCGPGRAHDDVGRPVAHDRVVRPRRRSK